MRGWMCGSRLIGLLLAEANVGICVAEVTFRSFAVERPHRPRTAFCTRSALLGRSGVTPLMLRRCAIPG
jgi:hypothetical protein